MVSQKERIGLCIDSESKNYVSRLPFTYSILAEAENTAYPPTSVFMRPFGCPHTILNTLDHLGKFDGKSEEGYLLGYSTNSKGFRVYNRVTRKVQDCLHVNFLESQENQKGKGPDWMFDLELLTPSMNYIPVRKENYADSGGNASSHDDVDDLDDQQFIVHGPNIHAAQHKPSEERTANKEFISLMNPKESSQSFSRWKVGLKRSKEETAQFKRTRVWCYVLKPDGKRGIGYKWVFRTRDMIVGLLSRTKHQSTTRLHRMDVKSAFLYGNITEEVYVKQPPGFEDPAHPNKVYRVVKALYGLHQAPRAWYERLSTFLLKHGYRRGAIDKTLFIKKDRRDIMLVQVYVDDIIFGSTKSSMVKDFEELMQKEFKMSSMGELTFFLGLQVKQTTAGIFLSQDKYVKDILNKFDFRTIKPASTPIEAHKSLGKDEEGEDVDVHLYRSMIGCLMYLTASRPDIMFAVCLCARFQVTPKVFHMHAVKRIFRYLKHQPKLGLWYPKDSPFHLEAFSDNDYAGDNHDRRSTSGGCQYLRRRLVYWQCKKQTIVAISSTEAEYVAAASCCALVLWMQNQLLDYGFNFMNTEIHIDNESTICIVRNPVLHSKTKHIQIRHHFIQDCYEHRLINVVKVHTDDNVADLLTKGFDLARFNFLVVTIEKTEHNADFHQIVDYLTGCSINYSLLVDPDLIGPWLQQFWATASLRVINEVPHIREMVAGKRVLISEETIRADLLFDDADGVDCFPKQVIWDSLKDIGYEGNLAQLTFSKPLFSPQWKYLVHVLLHCLSAKSTSWEQFGTNIASALVGLATNQNFNFSLMIMNGML
ncbi:putative ribonuclease H-like domain-containing protein [Tanacetum coccineum]